MKLDWLHIDSVFLDMDGTLLDLHFDNHFWLEYVPACYANRHRMALEQATDVVFSHFHGDHVYGLIGFLTLDSRQAGAYNLPAAPTRKKGAQ